MSSLIKEFLNRNRKNRLNIHCVGDAMVDEYYKVKVSRISPEFPMPIMSSFDDYAVRKPGGVANVAHQLKQFNVERTVVCFRDGDLDGVFFENGLHQLHISSDPRLWAKLPVKRRFLDGTIQVNRWDIENHNCGLNIEKIDEYHELYAKLVEKTQMNPGVVIFSDYDKGFFYPGAHIHFPSLYPNAVSIVDPKRGPISKWHGCNIFKPNAKEAEELSGKRKWEDQAKFFMDSLGCDAVVITHSGDGVFGATKDGLFEYKPETKVDVNSTVGAGDCFGAIFAVAIGQKFSVQEASEIAYNAGAVYVQHNMNRPCSPAELVEDGLVEPVDLAKRDFKLVFTNGCFDILHEGHLKTLKFAKSKGDKLVVAVNSDESVKRLKGEGRPVVPLAQRMKILSGLEYVDFVVSFHSDTPYDLIKVIKPEVLVKGAQYSKKEIVGSDLVKEVYRAPMVDGVSTTKILNGEV